VDESPLQFVQPPIVAVHVYTWNFFDYSISIRDKTTATYLLLFMDFKHTNAAAAYVAPSTTYFPDLDGSSKNFQNAEFTAPS
jgi:hypothetical protein